MKKIFTLIMCAMVSIAASAQTRHIDGRGIVMNGNHNFMIGLTGGAQLSSDKFTPQAGAELVYNYYALRMSIGANWGAEQTSNAQLGVYWNCTQNLNRKVRFYLGAKGGILQANAVIDQDLIIEAFEKNGEMSADADITLNFPKTYVWNVGAAAGITFPISRIFDIGVEISGFKNFVDDKIYKKMEVQIKGKSGTYNGYNDAIAKFSAIREFSGQAKITLYITL